MTPSGGSARKVYVPCPKSKKRSQEPRKPDPRNLFFFAFVFPSNNVLSFISSAFTECLQDSQTFQSHIFSYNCIIPTISFIDTSYPSREFMHCVYSQPPQSDIHLRTRNCHYELKFIALHMNVFRFNSGPLTQQIACASRNKQLLTHRR